MGCLKLISEPLTRAQLDQCYNIVYSCGNPPVAPVAGSTPPPPTRLGARSASPSTAALQPLSCKPDNKPYKRQTCVTFDNNRSSLHYFLLATFCIMVTNIYHLQP